MVEAPGDLPDWTKGFLLIGRDDSGNPVVVLVDDDGQMQVLLRGADAGGDPQTVRVDADGQLYTVLRGASDVDVAVDASGFMTTILKGIDGGADLRTLLTDSSGRIIMVPYGTTQVSGTATVTQADSTRTTQGIDGATLRTIVVDSSGQLIMVPKGQSGYYLAVDASGFMTTILKGIDGGAALRTLLTDTSGRVIMVPYGTTQVAGTATVTQDDSVREMQGADGETLRTIVVDANGQMVMVPRGQSGNYLAIDSSGFMTAVLKGITDSTLTTIKVDTDGRIEAFSLDSEDQWGQTLKVGNAELAARTGSLVAWDRRGLVAYANDFRDGLGNASLYPEGTGAAITLSPDYFVSGGYSMKLVGGSDGNHRAYIRFMVETPPSLKLGLEICYSHVSDIEWMMAKIRCYTGGKQWDAAIRYHYADYRVQYLNASEVWTDMTNPHFSDGGQDFHRMKVVADFAEAKFMRVLYSGVETDLSAQGLFQYSTGWYSALWIVVELSSRSGNNDVAYLDSIVLTTGEPD